jgi:hypothetical protein
MEGTDPVRVILRKEHVTNRSGIKVFCIAGFSPLLNEGLAKEIKSRKVAGLPIGDFILNVRKCIPQAARPEFECQNIMHLSRGTFDN